MLLVVSLLLTHFFEKHLLLRAIRHLLHILIERGKLCHCIVLPLLMKLTHTAGLLAST